MAAWKIGYPSGLDVVANENAGKALYDKWSISPITLSSKTPVVTGGQPTTVGTTILTDTGQFTGLNLSGGFLKIRSGTRKGNVYKVVSNTSDALTCKAGTTLSADGITTSDWYEVVSGSTTFTFPAQRNPTRKDFKRIVKGYTERFPYYEGGIDVPLGFEADDLVIMAFLPNDAAFEALTILLNQKMDYAGYDGNYTSDEAAPLILQTGTADAAHQHLVSFSDHKIVRDGGKGGYIDVMIHFRAINMPSYRGI